MYIKIQRWNIDCSWFVSITGGRVLGIKGLLAQVFQQILIMIEEKEVVQLEKLNPEKINEILKCFDIYQTDFLKIAVKAGIHVNQIKKQIISMLVNNIWKVCFIVRKRRISSLKSNLISNSNIKNLVVLMLKSNNFRNVKEEYGSLWQFISKHYPDDHFKSISDQFYKMIYRELIILAEKYNINYLHEDNRELGLEKMIVQQGTSKYQAEANKNEVFKTTAESYIEQTLNSFKKKVIKETIDLISDDSEDQFEEEYEEDKYPCELQSEINMMDLFQEKVITLYKINSMERARQNQEWSQHQRSQFSNLMYRFGIIDQLLNQ